MRMLTRSRKALKEMELRWFFLSTALASIQGWSVMSQWIVFLYAWYYLQLSSQYNQCQWYKPRGLMQCLSVGILEHKITIGGSMETFLLTITTHQMWLLPHRLVIPQQYWPSELHSTTTLWCSVRQWLETDEGSYLNYQKMLPCKYKVVTTNIK